MEIDIRTIAEFHFTLSDAEFEIAKYAKTFSCCVEQSK